MAKIINIVTIFHIEATNKIIEFAEKINVSVLPVSGAWLCHNNEKILKNSYDVDLTPEFIISEKDFDKFTTEALLNHEFQLRSEAEIFNRFSIKMGTDFLYFNIYKNSTFDLTEGAHLPVKKIWDRANKNEKVFYPEFEDGVLSYFWRIYHHLYKKNGQEEILILKHLVKLSNVKKLSNYSKDFNLRNFTDLVINKAMNNKHDKFVIKSKLVNLFKNKSIKKLIIKSKCSDNTFRYGGTSLKKIFKNQLNKDVGSLRSRLISTFAKTYIVRKEIGTKENEFRLLRRLNAKKDIGSCVNGEYLLSTSSGLWHLKHDKLTMIVPGGCFGITGGPKKWYLCQYTGDYSRIMKFTLSIKNEDIFLLNRKNYLTGLPPNIHQIDLFEDHLYIVNAADNSLIVSKKEGSFKEVFPNGKIKKGSPKSNHFNSVFIKDSKIHLMAHNGTSKIERNSEICILEKSKLKKMSSFEINAQKAHNIFFLNGKLGYCNSPKGELILDSCVIFKNPNYFLRGVAISSESIAVGGSEFATRENRDKTSSMLFELTLNGKIINEIFLEDIGQIYDIRYVGKDFGMSQDSVINDKN